MKRSEINQIMRSADQFIRERGLYLPPFAYWSPEDWASKGEEACQIAEAKLGWDIPDFGSGDFGRRGLFIFTGRNGTVENWRTRTGKLYCEKLLVVNEGQVTPFHFHWNKMEDIINRGGGKLAIQLYNSTPAEGLDKASPVKAMTDGVVRTVPAGGILELEPGESITLYQGLYHEFWAVGGRTLVGEVSLVNDDEKDNRFYEPVGRFPTIDEDETPMHLLCTDYPKYYRYAKQ